MDQIRNANIPLRIKNVRNPRGSGTIIYPSYKSGSNTPDEEGSILEIPNSTVYSFMTANGYYGEEKSRRAPTAITTKESIILVNIQSNRSTKSHGFLADVFNRLNSLDAVTDLITSSEQSVSLAISSLDSPDKVARLVKSLEKCGKVVSPSLPPGSC